MVDKKKPHTAGQNHLKCKCIKMESMAPDTTYAFTFNPSDLRTASGIGSKMIKGNELQTEKAILEQLDEWKSYLRKMKYCSFEVYPELSPTGRLHFHGFILVHNVLFFYFHDLYLLNEYSYEIDTIDPNTSQEYDIYVFKQKGLWQKFCEKHKYPYALKSNRTHIENI